MSEFQVMQGRQIPIQAPELPEPAIYNCPDTKTLSVFCQAPPGVIAKYLEPTPFEFVSDDFLVFVSDMRNCDFEVGGFFDMGLIIPVRYGDIFGGHVLFEYEDEDYGICAGRELWGYPKKYASATLEEKNGVILGSVWKKGVEIMRLEMDLRNEFQADLPPIKLRPHLQLHTVPQPDGLGIYSQRLMMRDTGPGCTIKQQTSGAGQVKLQSIRRNPLGEFTPTKIYGAIYEVSDFRSTLEHGLAKVIAELVKPE
ncbi:acetoacetate decarboxylase family protein [Brevibacillus nitrificans]|uniref:acetoacetate decarboxylase family protein n=1 Tax=Brevibacillus nitrificans TaxID=651560 RepID=UPI00261BE907|nr:acetoacetate decarboxylase family protein [Brevibacillus nitrificans]